MAMFNSYVSLPEGKFEVINSTTHGLVMPHFATIGIHRKHPPRDAENGQLGNGGLFIIKLGVQDGAENTENGLWKLWIAGDNMY